MAKSIWGRARRGAGIDSRGAKPPKARHEQKKATSTMTAEGYHSKYIIGGNASHARFLHYARLRKREA